MSDADNAATREPGSPPLSGSLSGQPVRHQLPHQGVDGPQPPESQASVGASVARWAASLRATPDGAVLPPHSPGCVGCGPENPHGLGMVVHREGETGVRTDLVFDARHLGAPGVAHGGAVAMAFDDVFGFLLYLVGELAVTRNLAVDYLAPVRLGPRYTLVARHDARIGRRLPVTAELRDSNRVPVATATATFIIVDVEHFMRAAGTVRSTHDPERSQHAHRA